MSSASYSQSAQPGFGGKPRAYTYNQWLCRNSGRRPGANPMRKFAQDAESEDPDAGFKPLTAEEARQLRERSPSVSPWRVIVAQALVGVLVALGAWGLTGEQNLGWSAGYGALSVVVPAAVFARGLTGRLSSLNPGTAMIGFFVWEIVKMALTLAMLLAAPRLITALNWPAMLVGLAVTMQAYWVALMFAPKRK
jgi:ATP synthase protein I